MALHDYMCEECGNVFEVDTPFGRRAPGHYPCSDPDCNGQAMKLMCAPMIFKSKKGLSGVSGPRNQENEIEVDYLETVELEGHGPFDTYLADTNNGVVDETVLDAVREAHNNHNNYRKAASISDN